MAIARYHLVFEGFTKEVNKTEIGFSLKSEMDLTDAQVADLMAGRRTVLANNLPKEDAQKMGRKLTQAGLKISAQALAVNQKNNPKDLRKHLLEGGLDQYFASRYKHPKEELDTIASLLILAAFPVLSYIILPLIGLLLTIPLISLSIWTSQPIAGLIQLTFGLIMFVPTVWLWPKPTKITGLELESDTEELLSELIFKLAEHLTAPTVKRIVLVETPVLVIHQTPLQWVKNESTLELGLPVLEALNLQQFVGLLAMRMTPLSSTLYVRTWGLFIQWYGALRRRYKPWALLLSNWVNPLHDHQNERGQAVAKELVGFAESMRLQRIDKRFNQLNRDWPEFVDFFQKLKVRGTAWDALVSKEAKSEKEEDEVKAAFRMESPALWVLSTNDGYQKMFQRQGDAPVFEMPGFQLWQQFQRLNPHLERYEKLLVSPEALVPPSEVPKKKKGLNAIRLNKQASDVLSAQRQLVEAAMGMHDKPKKPKDVNKLVAKWRSISANFWPDGFLEHKAFNLAKTVFLTLQTLQQIELWNISDSALDIKKHPARDKQIKALHDKWIEQIGRLPALPLLPANGGSKMLDQIQSGLGKKDIRSLTPAQIIEHQAYWMDFIRTYWIFVSGQVLTPKTFAEEADDE